MDSQLDYLITVKGDKRVDLKEFRKTHGLRILSFASADDLTSIMKLIPGAVTPLGLLADEDTTLVRGMAQEAFGKGYDGVWVICHDKVKVLTPEKTK